MQIVAERMRRIEVREAKLLSLLVFMTVTFAVIFFTQTAKSAELSEPYTSVRALGMGNAYAAVVEDADSLFYNPAGLADNSAFQWTIADPRIGINGLETVDTVMDIRENTDDLINAIDGLYGKRIWAGGGGKTAILLPNFAFAAYASSDVGLYAQNPAATTLNLNYFFDYGFAMGAGFSLIPKIWKMGFAARRVNRTGTTLPVGPSVLATLDTDALEDELRRRGVGYGLDYGTTFSVPGPISPSLSFVYKNIGYTTFTHEEGAGAPPRIDPEFDFGAAIKIDALIASITPSFEYKHITRTDVQQGKKIHLGLEVDLMLLALRAGLNQGYYTAGVGLDIGPLRIDAATYGVELGEYPGQQEDRRYVAQITFELGFDPGDFGFGGSGSKDGSGRSSSRKKVKQRR
ncbi:MAG TPA: hypothetical protein VM432_10325 [Bdellovibrionales bacterium]|nr:hypothetical protein [Bdellovibrionales bacterium]